MVGARTHFNRRWLDAGSMAAAVVVVSEQSGTFTLSDGHHSATLDFCFSTPEARALALQTAQNLLAMVTEFAQHVEAMT
jgi:hypothetical protein